MTTLIVAAMLVASVIWYFMPWEWSMIDDPAFVLRMQAMHAQYGPIMGTLRSIIETPAGDLSWGLFRPSYWVYPALVYPWGIGAAHVLRLLLFAAAVAGPIVWLARRERSFAVRAMAGLLLAGAAAGLAEGLFYVSLQELSGAAFVGIGLVIRGRWGRLIAWTVAAWFKSPFSWVLIGEAVVLWRRGQRRWALANAAVGSGTLLLAALFAKNGSYTTGRFTLEYATLWRITTNIPKLLEFGTAVMLVSLIWWLATTGTPLRFRATSLGFLIAWAGYTVQMLPWGITGYYGSPINYLLGLLLISMLTGPGALSGQRLIAALAVPSVLTVTVLWLAIDKGVSKQEMLRGTRECVQAIDGAAVALSPNLGVEAVERLEQNILLANPSWSGDVTGSTDTQSKGDAKRLYVDYLNTGAPPGYAVVQCVVKDATVYSWTGL